MNTPSQSTTAVVSKMFAHSTRAGALPLRLNVGRLPISHIYRPEIPWDNAEHL